VNESDQGPACRQPRNKESIMSDKSETLTRGHDGRIHQVPLSAVRVPDIWHAVTSLQKSIMIDEDLDDEQRTWMMAQTRKMLETWHLCHDLLRHARD
jgi:hypothetical protein